VRKRLIYFQMLPRKCGGRVLINLKENVICLDILNP